MSIPARWTSVISEDLFVKISAGRSLFRVEDLVSLCNLMENINRNCPEKAEKKYCDV